MMRFYIKLIIVTIFLLFLTFSYVSANEDIPSNGFNSSEDVKLHNFTELNAEIQNFAGDVYTLNHDYCYGANDSLVIIDRSITINGNAHHLDAKNSSLFEIKADKNISLILKNITFSNHANIFNINSSNITCFDCLFESDYDSIVYASLEFPSKSSIYYGGKPSNLIKQAALSIVGNSKDIAAAKKIAVWIKRNMASENKAGFYQSPDDSLKRLRSNCCCRSLLFLQMCESIGLTKNHKFYLVHVGNIVFGSRHFFVVVDNICVDTSLVSPWGRGGFFGRNVFSITEYPYLPLPKGY